MMQQFNLKVSLMMETAHVPTVFIAAFCLFALLVFTLGNVLASGPAAEGSDRGGGGSHSDVFILLLIMLAYFAGFANSNGKRATESKAMDAVATKKAQYPDSGQRAKKAATGATDAAGPGPTQEDPEQWEQDMQVIDSALQEGIDLDGNSYARVMGACARCNHAVMALELFTLMLEKGVTSDFSSIPRATASRYFKFVAENLDDQRMRESGLQLLEAIQSHRLVPTMSTQNQLIRAWRSKLPDDVVAYFLGMKEKGIELSSTAYRCIMLASEKTAPKLTLQLHTEMKTRGIKLDGVSLNAALSACSEMGMVNEALQLFEDMRGYEGVPDGKTYGLLIKTCCAAGKGWQALQFLEAMRTQQLVPSRWAYNDVIHFLVEQGCLNQAIQLYEQMIQAGTRPCDMTHVFLAKACRIAGCSDTANAIMQEFEHMKQQGGRWTRAGERWRDPGTKAAKTQ